jgi:hypothetical protein
MMSVAICVAPHLARNGLDSQSLFKLAEHALHRRRSESRIDVIQSLVLLSLRQTGCGDKLSAAVYCGRACSMVYALGLHLAPTGSKQSSTVRHGLDTLADSRIGTRGPGCTGIAMFSTRRCQRRLAVRFYYPTAGARSPFPASTRSTSLKRGRHCQRPPLGSFLPSNTSHPAEATSSAALPGHVGWV